MTKQHHTILDQVIETVGLFCCAATFVMIGPLLYAAWYLHTPQSTVQYQQLHPEQRE